MTSIPVGSLVLFATAMGLAAMVAPNDARMITPPVAAEQTCIAIVLPSVKGASGDATAFAAALRDRFASFLTGPSLRAVAIDARLTSQAVEEARQKQCDRVLLTSIEMKRHDGTGWGKVVGRAAGSAAWYGVPYGTAATAVARGAVVAGAQAISAMAETTRAKDEVILEYRFGALDGVSRAAAKVEKAKATRDGEDLLTPLVEKVSEAVAAAVVSR